MPFRRQRVVVVSSLLLLVGASPAPRHLFAQTGPAAGQQQAAAGSPTPDHRDHPRQSSPEDSWLQWGGPHGDFTSPVTGLADAWPRGGPRELWRRDLGEGDSAIVVDGERLFTMYRRDDREVVVALDSASGELLWEHDYQVGVRGFALEYGPGPHASPLVVGERLFTVGFRADLHAFDKRTGTVLWSVNLWRDLRGTVRDRGYSSSPIEYQGAIILPVGGRGQAVMAFDPSDGSVLWRGGDLDNAHATPLIIEVDGQRQLVAFMVDFVAGFDPTNGQLLWRHPHRTDYGLNISTPIWGDDNLLFVSSAYSGGSRALRLRVQDGITRVEEEWFTNRMRLHFGNAIRIGDVLYGANGDFGPSFVTALDMDNGNVLWRDRSFAKASFLRADGKLIVLDEDGVLGLVTVDARGMQELDRAQVFGSRSWTVPTLVGTTLYARDLREIAAFDLGAATDTPD